MPVEIDVRLLKYQCLGNGLVIGSQYSGLTGDLLARTVGMTATPTSISNLAYQWAADGNLTQRQDLRQSLLEGFTYDALNRLTQVTLNGAVTQSVGYDALGNITSRSDVGSYTYHPTRKHAVTQAGTRAFTYDANGNMLTRNGQTLAWRGDNLPALIRDQASSGAPVYQSEFAYGPAGERWRQIATYFNGTETIISIAGLLEKYTSSSAAGTTLYRHWIPAPDGTLIQVEVARNAGPGTLTTRYITRDHLGSVDAVLASTAAVLNRESFNAWGARRSATGWTGAPGSTEWAAIADTLRQGYTSDATNHTHLDNLGLIHMNGRILDPTLGRFLSADPAIPDPYSSQSWNRYSYVRNTFLSRLDPTGFAEESIEEVFVTDTRLVCQPWGVGYSGCADLCVVNPFSPLCPDLIQLNPYLQPAELRDDNPARTAPAQAPQSQQDQKPCTPSTVGQAIARNTTWNLGAGLGVGGKLFGIVNVELFHAFGGGGGNFAGQTWSYISGGGPAVEAKLGVARVGFSTGGGETRWGDHYFEESSEHAFIGFSSDAGTLKYGNRLEGAFIDAGISPDLGQMWRDWTCKTN